MGKYRDKVYALLTKGEIKSTNELLRELEQKTKRVINWHLLHRELMELVADGKVERLEAKAGFFWKRK